MDDKKHKRSQTTSGLSITPLDVTYDTQASFSQYSAPTTPAMVRSKSSVFGKDGNFDWLTHSGTKAVVANMESKGQSWLVSRASSTNLAGLDDIAQATDSVNVASIELNQGAILHDVQSLAEESVDAYDATPVGWASRFMTNWVNPTSTSDSGPGIPEGRISSKLPEFLLGVGLFGVIFTFSGLKLKSFR